MILQIRPRILSERLFLKFAIAKLCCCEINGYGRYALIDVKLDNATLDDGKLPLTMVKMGLVSMPGQDENLGACLVGSE